MRTDLLLTFVLGGGLLVVLGVPLLLGKVPPNGFYGVRLRATFEDPRVWYETNRKGGLGFLLVGVGTIALTLALGASRVSDVSVALASAAFLTLGALATAAWCAVYARRRLRELRSNPR
jgi:uncharacterized membrane protein